MMKCPLKFSRYEFEGGEECIGAECGFYGGVCGETNGICDETNGIGADAPLVDAVTILREADDGSLRLKAFAYDPHSLTKLADMVERDYVRREKLDAEMKAFEKLQIVKEEIIAERDEWKAKVKTLAGYLKHWRERCAKLEYRSDKRAAAVERLRKMQYVDDYGDWVEAIAEVVKGTDKSNIGDYGMWKSLIDLLTDEDAHSKAQSKTEPNLSEQPEPLSDEVDSREKIEVDAGELTADYASSGDVCDALYCGIIGLLDRQSAITERQYRELTGTFQLESDKRITELQAKVDGLTGQLEAAHAKNRALKLHIGKMQAGRHGWHVKGVELQRQVDELTAQLHASNAERSRLRECLGIATDNAHDFLTLVDNSGNVHDRDEGLA